MPKRSTPSTARRFPDWSANPASQPRDQAGGSSRVWFEDSGTGVFPQPIFATFNADGTFALGGLSSTEWWISGTCETRADAIVFTPTGGACGGSTPFSWRLERVEDGRFESVHEGISGDRRGILQ
jgi:hypothetical protein